MSMLPHPRAPTATSTRDASGRADTHARSQRHSAASDAYSPKQFESEEEEDKLDQARVAELLRQQRKS